MNIVDFRQLHSQLILEYQLVEEKLRFIYLFLDKHTINLDMDTMDYWDGLNKESIGKLIKMINSKSDEHKAVVFDEKLIEIIDKVREKRNFWCHQCYLKLVFSVNGESKLKDLETRMNSDIDDAKKMVLDLIDVIDKVEKLFVIKARIDQA